MLPHEHDHSHVANSGDPGVADQLGIEGQQPIGFLGIAAARCFPIDQILLVVKLPDGVDVETNSPPLGNDRIIFS